MDLFKDLINNSVCPLDKNMGGPLKVRYVCAVILEFIRCIYENGIPLQPQQQTLFLGFLLLAKEYALLHQMLQFHVCNDSIELAKILVTLGSKAASSTATYY